MTDAAQEAPENPFARWIASAIAFGEEIKALDCKPGFVQLRIDGLMYTSTKLPASAGLALWPRVTALLGAALTKAVVTGESSDMDPGVLVRLAERAMRDGLVDLIRDLLARTDCFCLRSTGKPGKVAEDFDAHFAGEYAHLLKVCVFVLTHNLRGPTYGAH